MIVAFYDKTVSLPHCEERPICLVFPEGAHAPQPSRSVLRSIATNLRQSIRPRCMPSGSSTVRHEVYICISGSVLYLDGDTVQLYHCRNIQMLAIRYRMKLRDTRYFSNLLIRAFEIPIMHQVLTKLKTKANPLSLMNALVNSLIMKMSNGFLEGSFLLCYYHDAHGDAQLTSRAEDSHMPEKRWPPPKI